MNRKAIGLAASLAMLALAACTNSSSTGGGTNNTPVAQTSKAPSPSASTAPVTVDPCQVVTASEASQLAGATYTTGKEESPNSGDKICVYGAATLNVFEVGVLQASSASLAQAQWDQEKSQVEAQLKQQTNAPGVTFTVNITDTSIPGADRAAAGSYSAQISSTTLNGAAVYMLKGPYFVAIVDLNIGHPPATVSQMEAAGTAAIARIP